MKKNHIYLKLFILFIIIGTNDVYCQAFKQLTLKNDSVINYILKISASPKRLNAFGNFRNNLFLTIDNNRNRALNGDYKNYYYKNDEKNIFYLFSYLDAETGKFSFLNIDYKKYLPIAFINNDTILLKINEKNEFIGYVLSINSYITVSDNFQLLTPLLPSDLLNNKIYKINVLFNEMILLSSNETVSNTFKIYTYSNERNFEKLFNLNSLLKSWGILDIYWYNEDNILLSLAKPVINGIGYCQKIYNIKTNKIIDINLPRKDLIFDDYYNGLCICRSGGINSSAFIYKLDIKNDKVTFSKKYEISKIDKTNQDPLFELGFISKDKIARITDIEAEKNYFNIYLNLENNNIIQMYIKNINQKALENK